MRYICRQMLTVISVLHHMYTVFYLETCHPGILFGHLDELWRDGQPFKQSHLVSWVFAEGGSTVNKSDEKLKAMLCIGLILSN